MKLHLKNRIKRVFLSLKNTDPDNRHIFGYKAEKYVEDMLLKAGMPVFSNKILKHPKLKSRYIESDIILYSGSSVFCIEIKRLKGKIFHSKDGIVQENYKPFARRYQGYRAKRIKDPKKQSGLFCNQLKKYLTNKSERFGHIRFIPVAVFSQEADISQIHSKQEGILYIDELIGFIKSHTKQNETEQERVVKELEKLKGFDIVINRKGLPVMGFIQNEIFECLCKNGVFSINFSSIKSIDIKRSSFLSAYDDITINLKNGQTEHKKCLEGHISFDSFGNKQKHFLRNINSIHINSR